MATLRAPARTRYVALASAACAATATLAHAGADLGAAASASAPLLLIVGYSAVAVLVTLTGATAAVGAWACTSPLKVFAVAATLTLVTSNDAVILTLAPVIFAATRRPHRLAAALFIGANVSAIALPHASPTNLMVAHIAGLTFSDYVQHAAPATGALVVTAGLAVAALLRRESSARERLTLTTVQRRVLTGAGVALLAQPAAQAAGVPRAALGLLLLAGAATAAALVTGNSSDVIAGAAWLVLPIGAVMIASGQLVAAHVSGLSEIAAASLLFASSGLFTDLAAAAPGAHLAADGIITPALVLVSVTAGAFLTPVGSLSGLLLCRQFADAGVPLRPATTFAVPAVIATVCWAAATAAVLATT